jgi:hypothetical protein
MAMKLAMTWIGAVALTSIVAVPLSGEAPETVAPEVFLAPTGVPPRTFSPPVSLAPSTTASIPEPAASTAPVAPPPESASLASKATPVAPSVAQPAAAAPPVRDLPHDTAEIVDDRVARPTSPEPKRDEEQLNAPVVNQEQPAKVAAIETAREQPEPMKAEPKTDDKASASSPADGPTTASADPAAISHEHADTVTPGSAANPQPIAAPKTETRKIETAEPKQPSPPPPLSTLEPAVAAVAPTATTAGGTPAAATQIDKPGEASTTATRLGGPSTSHTHRKASRSPPSGTRRRFSTQAPVQVYSRDTSWTATFFKM